MSTQSQLDVSEIAFHESNPPLPPVVMLAEQLERIAYGVETAVVFSYASGLPTEFDPSNPPDGIEPNSEQAMLVDRFYHLQTSRECPVTEDNYNTGTKKRCMETCHGFRDILTHQEVKHDRKCHYLCLLENCLAPFDKVGNAKRHFTSMHSEEAARRRRERAERRRGHTVQARAAARRATEVPRTSSRIAKTPIRNGSQSSLLSLSLVSEIEDEPDNNIRVTISSSESSTEDIAMFHNDNIVAGTLRGECQSEAEKEWVAATALLDLWFNPKKVDYEFT